MIVEISKDNRKFCVGDLVSIETNQDFYSHMTNGIVTEPVEADGILYYAVYWPDGEIKIIFSGALRYVDNGKDFLHRRPRRIDERKK